MFEEDEKPKKKKREVSAERKAQLLENLKKGRETSKINRAKKKKAKEIVKADQKTEIEDIIINNRKKNNNNKDLEDQIFELKNKLNKYEKDLPPHNYKPPKEPEPPKPDKPYEKKKNVFC